MMFDVSISARSSSSTSIYWIVSELELSDRWVGKGGGGGIELSSGGVAVDHSGGW